MRKDGPTSLAAIVKKADPMEKPPTEIDMTGTKHRQEEFVLPRVLTEDPKIIETDLVVSFKHHTHKNSSSQRHTKQNNGHNEG